MTQRAKAHVCLLCGGIPRFHNQAKHVYLPSSRGTEIIIGLYQLRPGDIITRKNSGGTVTVFRGGTE